MSGACGTHGRDDKCVRNFWLGNMKGRDHLEHLALDGNMMDKWILRILRRVEVEVD
jgi:hypothetical protein